MPDEYISREAAVKYIKSEQCRTCSDIGLCGNCAVLVAVKLLEKVPAADVAEVVQGSGKVRATDEAETTQIIDGCCTACGAFMNCCEAAEYEFCPMCGRKFRRNK